MSKTIWSAALGAIACAAVVQVSAQRSAPLEAPKTADTITVIGCVQRSDASDTKYILVDNRGVETNPTKRGDTYRLEAAPAPAKAEPGPQPNDLDFLTGQQVEVKGVLTAAGTSSSASVPGTPKLKPQSVTRLSLTCPK
jgi:hypothetical protein